MAGTLSLVVRFVHVLGMAVVLGGALFAWDGFRSGPAASDPLRRATRYEWAFWGVLAAMLVTGIGNLAAVGAPPPSTTWGTVLAVKLLLVLALVVGSFLRTLVVLRLGSDRPADGTAVADALRPWYGATLVALVVLVSLGEALAHG